MRRVDQKHHGGPQNVLHHYPRDHYAALQSRDWPVSLALGTRRIRRECFDARWTETCLHRRRGTFRLGPVASQPAVGQRMCSMENKCCVSLSGA